MLGHFLSKTYDGTCFLRRERQPTERQLIALQEQWRDRVGLLALRIHWAPWTERGSRKGSTRQGKDCQTSREDICSKARARWKNAVGRWPKSSRDPVEDHQAGAFADFVRATASVLPQDFKIGSLDRAIRAACERPE